MKPLGVLGLAAFCVAGVFTAHAANDWLVSPAQYKARCATNGSELELSNGLVRRTILVRPNAATVALDHLTTGESLLRSVRAEARLEINGRVHDIGGLRGQSIHNYLKRDWLKGLTNDPSAFVLRSLSVGPTRERFPWKRNLKWLPDDVAWPAPGISVAMVFDAPESTNLAGITAEVHYELYDGLPLFSKWLAVTNSGTNRILLNRAVFEHLAVVEPESIVDGAPANFRRNYSSLEVFTDYSFGGNMTANADAPAVKWLPDPFYATQVHYERQTPCLLECSLPIGPSIFLSPGERFESPRAFLLVHDSTDRERRGMAVRKAYRALAPWTQENPILMHVRSARPEAVRTAIDQCAEIGFEMVIMTFGSGFDIENEKPEYLAQIKELADYASRKGIALGGYSLLASRSIDAENDAIHPQTGKPGGARFGNSPCLGSPWGTNYFRKLRQFYEHTGCAVLEHDGSYPGDVCASTSHPGHMGLKDSQWQQWRTISEFYKWCRARGVYLNVPDWYYLSGSSKCGMGYRETNWSLPRDEQEIIERQNIFDGTWEKTPSMGWMFVPLTEYHGGGAEATIEPLKDHLAHYETRLANLFGAGVQACYRGPRLYDSDETKNVVAKWVQFYKQHRAILDSDILHLRRPDGRDWDGWLHVNPALEECALAVFYNPLPEEMAREISIPLYYSGLSGTATCIRESGESASIDLSPEGTAQVSISIPAKGRTWFVFKKAE